MDDSRYTNEVVENLINKYSLTPEFEGQSLRERLDGRAWVYFMYKPDPDQASSLKAARKQLETVRSRAEKLLNLIGDGGVLSRTAMAGIDDVQNEIQKAAFTTSINHPDTDDMPPHIDISLPHGLKFTRIRVPDDGHAQIVMDWTTIMEALKHLETYTRVAKERLRGNPPGPQMNFALRMWASNIDKIWREYKGEPLSLTRIGGVIKSAPALFAIEALKLIDPSVPEVSIANAMRYHISREKKKVQR